MVESVVETTIDSCVLVRLEEGVGRLTLNRAEVINALTHEMVREVSFVLADWAHSPDVEVVVIEGAGDRGLCAGGDIRAIYDDTRAERSVTPSFWADEYRLNLQISEFPKPFVSIMDGLVMGGGVGIAAHGSHRIVTERSKVAMPEVGIGLVPDVGGSMLLARAPGNSGLHAALTGEALGAADAIQVGLADHFVPSASIEPFLQALPRGGLGSAIEEFTLPPGPSELEMTMQSIGGCYDASGVPEIVERLADLDSPAARRARSLIERHSPTCVCVTHEAILRARHHADLRETLEQEFRVSIRCLEAPDLAEGIRAQIIDKDRDPHWQPATLDLVTDDRIATYFAPLGDRELDLSDGDRRT
jgi:enoyl-CoA hydratase